MTKTNQPTNNAVTAQTRDNIAYVQNLLNNQGHGTAALCHGRPWCDKNRYATTEWCEWCHELKALDGRSLEDICNDIERQRLGH